MTGTKAAQSTARVGSSGFDFDHFERRLTELGGTTDEKRAQIAGISVRTYYRLQNGEASLRVKQLDDIADRHSVTRAWLIGEEPS